MTWTPTWMRTRTAHAAGFTLFIAGALTLYVFIISAGHFTSWRTWTTYYDPQAEGFRSGHLYTTVPVPPALKTLKNPLDPVNVHHWRWDYSYYEGHIYIYWGLLPPAILAAVKALFRIRHTIGDDRIVFAFLAVQALAGSLLVRALARRLTPPPPRWSVWVAMAAFALAHPTPFLLARGAVYEGAIAAGSCFLVLAFYCAFEGIFATRPASGVRWLMAASLFTGCAGTSRANLFPAAAAIMTVAALARWHTDGGGWRRLARLAPLLAAPLALLTFGQLLLNRLRFGAWTEFGQKYQMGFGLFPFRPRFFLADAFLYLFHAPSRWCQFPFISAEWDPPKTLFPRWLPVPADYLIHEPVAGMFVLVPMLCFLIALPMALGLARADPGGGSGDDPSPGAVAATARWRWFFGILAVAALATMIFPMLIGTATMRYQGDFAPSLWLMACVGGWSWLAAFRRRTTRAIATALFVVLAAISIVAGPLIGITGYFSHFQTNNPKLFETLHRARVCDGEYRPVGPRD